MTKGWFERFYEWVTFYRKGPRKPYIAPNYCRDPFRKK